VSRGGIAEGGGGRRRHSRGIKRHADKKKKGRVTRISPYAKWKRKRLVVKGGGGERRESVLDSRKEKKNKLTRKKKKGGKKFLSRHDFGGKKKARRMGSSQGGRKKKKKRKKNSLYNSLEKGGGGRKKETTLKLCIYIKEGKRKLEKRLIGLGEKEGEKDLPLSLIPMCLREIGEKKGVIHEKHRRGLIFNIPHLKKK